MPVVNWRATRAVVINDFGYIKLLSAPGCDSDMGCVVRVKRRERGVDHSKERNCDCKYAVKSVD